MESTETQIVALTRSSRESRQDLRNESEKLLRFNPGILAFWRARTKGEAALIECVRVDVETRLKRLTSRGTTKQSRVGVRDQKTNDSKGGDVDDGLDIKLGYYLTLEEKDLQYARTCPSQHL